MRAAQLYEDVEPSGSEAEFSLGLGSLVGIFFALALVCGIFFGFGYTLGHRAPGPYVSSEPLYVSPQPKPAIVAPKPSAQVPEQSTDASRVTVPGSSIGSAAGTETSALLARQGAPVASTTRLSTQPELRVANSSPAALPVANTASAGTIMVQIAAVKSRTDAEALATALQKNGFNPTIRSESQDRLLHVQIGPFDNREDAKQMRQKLSNSGYNAFIK